MVEKMDIIRTKVRYNFTKAGAILTPILPMFFLRDVDGTRDRLPEPFDFMDHIGNVLLSAQVGAASGVALGSYYCHRLNKAGQEVSNKRLRTIMGIGATTVGLVINSLSETKLGINLSLVNASTTPDMIDFAYGVGAATVGGIIIPEVIQQKPINTPYSCTRNQPFYE